MKQIKRLLASPLAPFVCLLLVQLACHLTLNLDTGGGDDAYYAAVIPGEGLAAMLRRHYQIWSARTLLEIAEAVVCWLPETVWRLLNPVIITLCAYGVTSLCGAKKQPGVCWAVCGLFLVYPWAALSSAGWRVTTVVYVWTAAALLAALAPMVRLMRGEKPSRGLCLAALPLTLFAANMEQVLVILLAALMLYMVYRTINRQPFAFVLLVQLCLCLAMLAYTLTAPGVAERFEVETASYLDFSMLGFFQKLELGVSFTLVPLVYGRDVLFDFFCLLLAALVWQNNRGAAARVLGTLPAVVSLFFSWLAPRLPFGGVFSGALQGRYGIITLQNHGSPAAYGLLVVLYMVFILCLVDIYLALGHRPLALAGAAVLVCGFLSRVTMGFSPTVVYSGQRTGFYLAVAIIAVCCLLLRQLKIRAAWWGVAGYTAVLAALRTVSFLQL